MSSPTCRLIGFVVLLCGWCFAPSGNTLAADAADSSTRTEPIDDRVRPGVQHLIDQLGSTSFATRQQATRQLKQIGPTAKPALVEALTNKDAEIRHRARDILAHVLDIDLENRIAAYVADDTGTFDDLPGLKLYQSVAGTSRSAQRMYIHAIRAEPLLLEALENDADDSAITIKARAQQLWNQFQHNRVFQPMTVDRNHYQASAAALLISISNPEIKLDDRTLYFILQHLERSGLTANFGSEQGEALRGLIRPLIVRSADTAQVSQFLRLALTHKLKCGLVPAEAIIQDRESERRPFVVLQAILAVGKLGSREHLELLKPLLADSSSFNQAVNGRAKVKLQQLQVRDVALAVMIHLSGQNPKDFGYSQIMMNSTWLFDQRSMGFRNDEERDAALKKWQAWHDGESAPATSDTANR